MFIVPETKAFDMSERYERDCEFRSYIYNTHSPNRAAGDKFPEILLINAYAETIYQ